MGSDAGKTVYGIYGDVGQSVEQMAHLVGMLIGVGPGRLMPPQILEPMDETQRHTCEYELVLGVLFNRFASSLIAPWIAVVWEAKTVYIVIVCQRMAGHLAHSPVAMQPLPYAAELVLPFGFGLYAGSPVQLGRCTDTQHVCGILRRHDAKRDAVRAFKTYGFGYTVASSHR